MLRPKVEDQRFRIILILLIVITGFYFFYFFILLNQKQQNLVEKGYRVLIQISKNIDDKYNNYLGSIPNFVKQEEFIQLHLLDTTTSKRNDILNNLHTYNIHVDDTSYLNAILKSVPDSTGKVKAIKKYLSSLQNINLKTSKTNNHSEYLISIEKDKHVAINDFMESVKYDDFFADIILYKKDSSVVYSHAFDEGLYNQIKWDSLSSKELNHFTLAGKDYKVLSLPIYIKNNKYILLGMIDNKKYAGVSKQFSPFALASVGVVLFLILTSIPLLKLRLLSKYERLSRGDVYLAGLSAIMVTAFITLIALGIGDSQIEKEKIKNNLEYLSSNISAEINKEIRLINHTLKQNNINASFLSKENSQLFNATSTYNIWNELVTINTSGFIDNYQTGFYPYFGDPDSLKFKLKNVDLSNRNYFKNIKNTNPKESNFYLEPVYSYTTGNVEVAISQKVANNKIKLITSPMYSLLDIVLPKDYSYFIIDTSGKVIFHEKNKKILRENFFNEISNKNKITQSIQSGANRCINILYSDKPKICRITPLNIPNIQNKYSLITTYNLYALQSQVITKTLSAGILLTFYFVLLLLISAVLKINKHKPDLLKHKVFSFHFLLPSIKHQHKYFILIILHFILAIILASSIFTNNNASLHYKLLHIVNSVLISSFYIFYYLNDIDFRKGFFINGKFYAELLLFLIISSVVYTIFIYGEVYSYYIVLFLLFFWKGLWLKKIKTTENYSRTYRGFYWFAFSWIVLIAILPTIILYFNSNDTINQHQVKESVNHYYQNYEAHRYKINEKYSYDSYQKEGKLSKQKIYFENFNYQSKLDWVFKSNRSISFLENLYYQDLNLPILNWQCHLFPKEIDDKSLTLLHDTLSFLEKSNIDKIDMNISNDKISNSPTDKTIYQAFVDIFHLSNLDNNLLINSNELTIHKQIYIQAKQAEIKNLIESKYLIIAIALLLIMLSCVIILSRIRSFTHRVKPLYKEKNMPVSIKDLRKIKKIILVGLPGTRKELTVNEIVKNEEVSQRMNFAHLNYKEVTQALEKLKNIDKGTIVLENFDHNHNHHELNKLRLLCLQALIDKQVKTIITSSISLTQILDDFFNLWSKAAPEQQESIKANMDQLESLLFDYIIITLPLPSFEKGPLAVELCHGHYLFSLQSQFENNPKYSQINDFYELPRKFKEELIIEVQDMAHAYYHALWNHCTRLEKHVLYDAAEDGFINHKNKITIVSLLKKGLLVFDDGIKIMNRSFQHFILTGISSSEVMQMEQEAKTSGRWSRYSLVIAVLILSIIIFYIVAEQQMVNKFTALISGLVAFVPPLISILRSSSIKYRTSK